MKLNRNFNWAITLLLLLLGLQIDLKSQEADSMVVDYIESNFKYSKNHIKKCANGNGNLKVQNWQIPFSYYSGLQKSFLTLDSKQDSIIAKPLLRHFDSLRKFDTNFVYHPYHLDTSVAVNKFYKKVYLKKLENNLYIVYSGPELEGHLPYKPIFGRVNVLIIAMNNYSAVGYNIKQIDYN